MITRALHGRRAVVWLGATLTLLLVMVVLAPRFLSGRMDSLSNLSSTPTPTSTATPAQEVPITKTPNIGSIQHTVVEGENLFSIAETFNLEAQTILWANADLLKDNPGNIQPGIVLRIPAVDGLYYRWATGNTIEAVAERFGADPQAILDWPENPAYTGTPEDPGIKRGMLLFIPGGKMPLQPAALPTLDAAASMRILSPDGRWGVVYQPGPGLLAIEDAQSRQNLLSAFSGVVSPGNWSPDNHHLLFWENETHGASIQVDGLPLWSLDVPTGEAKLISTTLVNPAYQSWSPDGGKLAFTNGSYRSAQIGKWLSIFNAYTGQVSDLIPKEKLIPGAVAWSPAGEPIAVAAVEAGQTGPDFADYMAWDNPAIAARRVYLVDSTTGEYRRLTQSEAYEDAPRWSQDGKQLLFVQANGSQARLMKMELETGLIEAVEGCEAPMPPDAGYYGQVDWSGLYANCPGSQG